MKRYIECFMLVVLILNIGNASQASETKRKYKCYNTIIEFKDRSIIANHSKIWEMPKEGNNLSPTNHFRFGDHDVIIFEHIWGGGICSVGATYLLIVDSKETKIVQLEACKVLFAEVKLIEKGKALQISCSDGDIIYKDKKLTIIMDLTK